MGVDLKRAANAQMHTKAAVIWYLCFSIALLSQGCSCTQVCGDPSVKLVTRAEWNARKPKGQSSIEGSVGMAFIHHTVTDECFDEQSCISMVKSVQNDHMKKWDDIGYSFLIGEDGRVYEGRGWGVVGAHTLHYNAAAYGFSMIGNFMKKVPNKKALKAVKAIINCGVQKGFIKKNYELFGHMDGYCTECPGDKLYNLIKTWDHYSSRKITKYCK